LRYVHVSHVDVGFVTDYLEFEMLPLARSYRRVIHERRPVFFVQRATDIEVPVGIDPEIAAVSLDIDEPEIGAPTSFAERVDEAEVVVSVIGEEDISFHSQSAPILRSSNERIYIALRPKHHNPSVIGIVRFFYERAAFSTDFPTEEIPFEVVREPLLCCHPLRNNAHNSQRH
jgi:hypothetical protein